MTTTDQSLFDEPPAKRRERRKDELWEAMLAEWYPTLDPLKVPETMRKELNAIHRTFSAYADCTPDEMRRRHAEAVRKLKGTQYATARKVANDWAAFAGEHRASMPNVDVETESYSEYYKRRKAEELESKRKHDEIRRLQDRVSAAPKALTDRLLAQWWEENPNVVKYVRSATHFACVRWIAERL